MIRHCVFVRFRNDAADAERAAIHADLEALRAVIDGMGKVEFSANTSPEPFARGFTHGFTIDFAMLRHAMPIWSMKRISEPAQNWSRRSKAAPMG
ncbi:Dabb family protein [Mesorhizobium sp. M0012]